MSHPRLNHAITLACLWRQRSEPLDLRVTIDACSAEDANVNTIRHLPGKYGHIWTSNFFPLVAEAHDRVGCSRDLVPFGGRKTPAQNCFHLLSVNHENEPTI